MLSALEVIAERRRIMAINPLREARACCVFDNPRRPTGLAPGGARRWPTPADPLRRGPHRSGRRWGTCCWRPTRRTRLGRRPRVRRRAHRRVRRLGPEHVRALDWDRVLAATGLTRSGSRRRPAARVIRSGS
ncbi:hypothetical protein HBB16_02230 [Pseudonocardia sp. MCCB 268]|nr:hypothetical protein [Pseudonocardia cytotoxica]